MWTGKRKAVILVPKPEAEIVDAAGLCLRQEVVIEHGKREGMKLSDTLLPTIDRVAPG